LAQHSRSCGAPVSLAVGIQFMSAEDWFRNRDWNDKIEAAFYEKLRRARRKEQYLRIQACILADSCPKVALKLLDEYFELKDDFDHAQAYVDQATAYLALGDVEQALDSYERALLREDEFPNLLTNAYIDLPFLVAIHGIKKLYPRALDLLGKHEDRLMFPVHYFWWHASKALIYSNLGDIARSRDHAEKAFEAAKKDNSGFRYPPTVGLVGDTHIELREQLHALSNA
jgi:tetratricopeptide (TPR) repeat protein